MGSTVNPGKGGGGGKKGRKQGGGGNSEQPKSEIKPFESPRRKTIKDLEKTLNINIEQTKPTNQTPQNKKPSKLRQSLNRALGQADKTQDNIKNLQDAVS